MFADAEIEVRQDMKLESDKKLEKLESFLGRLNSKGECQGAIRWFIPPKYKQVFVFHRFSFINVFPLSSILVSGLHQNTIAVTEKAVKEVMTLEDETFDKFYRHTEEMAKITSGLEINDDFDAIFGTQMPRYHSIQNMQL